MKTATSPGRPNFIEFRDLKDDFGQPPLLNSQRRKELAMLRGWHYVPFSLDGQVVPAIVTETLREQESPGLHLAPPSVSLDEVAIGLRRTGCYGSCPSYQVEVSGSGRAVYAGSSYVDVLGRHAYQVSPSNVAGLVASFRAKDIWSLRPEYRASVTDNPSYHLHMKFGRQVHELEDYVGQSAGMPAAVSRFEDEVDKAAGADMWVHLSMEAVKNLEQEHFAFASQEGAELLARAVADDESHDDAAMLRVLQLGAPIESVSATRKKVSLAFQGPVLEQALRNHRAILIEPLIAKGALKTAGRPDQEKIDTAFRAAIDGGRLALVQKMWNVSGDNPHPSLTFNDTSGDDKRTLRSPVTLLLSMPYRSKVSDWEGMEIARWLEAHGCDIKATAANGATLLHIASSAGDLKFVRYLLDEGFNPSTPGEFGLPALGSTEDEDVAMLLLQAGTNVSRLDDPHQSFRSYAVSRHWLRVVNWLDAHNGSGVKQAHS